MSTPPAPPPSSSPRNAVTGRGLVLPPTGPAPAGAPARPLAPVFANYLARSYEEFLALGGSPALADPAVRALHAPVVTLLRELVSRDANRALTVFAAPGVGTPLHALRLRGALPEHRARIDRGALAITPHLLLELARRGALPPDRALRWPAVTLASPSIGGVLTPPEGAGTYEFRGGELVAFARDAGPASEPLARVDLAAFDPRGLSTGFAFSPAYFPTGGVTRLSLYDHNPLADFEAHPEKRGNAIALGGRDPAEWTRALDGAFALVAAHVPELFDEMKLLQREVVPVGFDAERHLSASYREAIGTVYLTLHPHEMTLAEALVHEFQHTKLNAAAYATDFLENAYEPLYPSPVRPDPRPLWGILLAVHAFLPVAVLYRRMRAARHPRSLAPDFARRMGEIDLRNREGMAMLRANGRFTPAGAHLMRELDALDYAHMGEREGAGLETAPVDVHLG